MLNKEIQYSKTILAYYAILMIILVSWTNVNSLPPFFLRLMFLMAVVLPLWVKRTRLFVPIFLTFIMTSASSYAVSYMPVDGLNILLTIVMSILIISRTHTGSLSVPFGFIILWLLSTIIDFIYDQVITISFHWLTVIFIAVYLLKKNDKQQLKYIVLSLSIVSLILSLEFITVGDRFIRNVSTIAGNIDRKGWSDPNYFGVILGINIIASLIEILINGDRDRKLKYFYLLSIILSLYTLFSTASRGVSLALGCSVFFLFLGAPIKWKKRLCILVGGVTIILTMYYFHILDLLVLRFNSDAGDAGGRIEIWSIRLSAFLSECNIFQWLFGIGTHKALTLGTGRVLGFHNDFLSVLIRYGFIGLLSLISLLFSPIIHAPKEKKCIIFSAVLFLIICMNTIEPFTSGQWGALYFYLYILMLSQTRYADNQI